MRPALAVAALLALAALPDASASGAALRLEGPQDVVRAEGATQAQVRAHVVLDDAVCGSATQIRVRLAAYAPSGVEVAIPQEVVVPVPEGGYVAQPFAADADATLSIRAPPGSEGGIMVAAGYDLPPECVTSGETSARAQLQVRFLGPATGASATPAPDASSSAAAPAPSHGGAGLVALLLGVGVVATVFFVVGRLGQRGQVGGRDDAP